MEVPRQSGTSTDMYYVVSEDLSLSAEERREARARGERPTTLRSINELSRHLSSALPDQCPIASTAVVGFCAASGSSARPPPCPL